MICQGIEVAAVLNAIGTHHAIGRKWYFAFDDTIVFAQRGKGIMRLSANGGTPEVIVKEGIAALNNPIHAQG